MKNEKNKTEIIEKWKQNDRVIRCGPSWLRTESIWFLTMLRVHQWQLFSSPLLLFVVVIERLRSVLRPNRKENLGVANRSKPSAVSCWKSGWKKKYSPFIPDVSIKTELFHGGIWIAGKTIHDGESDILFYKNEKKTKTINVYFLFYFISFIQKKNIYIYI